MKLLCIVGEYEPDVFDGLSVIRADTRAYIDCPDCAVIVGKNAELSVSSALGVIVSEDSGILIPRGIQLISCGISHTNAISFTSRSDDGITLSLNRTLRTAGGVIEPLEQPVPFPRCNDVYEIMAAFAARLLLDGKTPR